MGAVKTILIVAFVIICVLLVLLVLVQNEDSNGMGSSFGGGQSTAFGAHGASVLSKTTGVLVALFFLVTFGIAFFNRPSKSSDLSETAKKMQGTEAVEESESNDWTKEFTEVSDGASEEAAVELPEASAE